MKKDVEQISVKTVRATSPLHKLLMVLHTECQKQPSRVFRHSPVLNIFENTGGRVLIVVMTACGNFTFNWILTLKTSFLCLLI